MAQNLDITDINLESGRYGSKSGDSWFICVQHSVKYPCPVAWDVGCYDAIIIFSRIVSHCTYFTY